MIRLASVSDATFVPYSHDTATITFGQTVYGGSVDFKTGKVTVTHVSIASYNGETINEPWLSSIDEYVRGTTLTTGAQVVYPLATPIELTLTPAELELLKGYNYISTNGTTIALDYLPDSLLAEAESYVDALVSGKGTIRCAAIEDISVLFTALNKDLTTLRKYGISVVVEQSETPSEKILSIRIGKNPAKEKTLEKS
jgi:hypothetical protein